MTNTRDSATNVPEGGVAGEAALIATFYSRRDLAPRVHEELYRSASGAAEDSGAIPDDWTDPSGEVFLRRFDPPATHDTMVVQLALNAPGDAASAWEVARGRLKNLLDGDNLSSNWWGYTLIYQAELAPGVAADLAMRELQLAVRTLHSSESLQPLAQADVPGGKVWLLSVPISSDGLAAATVYVALGPAEREEALMKELYGPGARLLMPDLIAHKGYHQMRQHRGEDIAANLDKNLENLRRVTTQLLQDLAQGVVNSNKLEQLARQYPPLIPIGPYFEELHTSMIRQSYNYDRWLERVGGLPILEFHREQLEAGTKELELLATELNNALETANRVVSLAQVRQDSEAERGRQVAAEKRESQQRKIEVWIAALALGLALPELINQDAARALLKLLKLLKPLSQVIPEESLTPLKQWFAQDSRDVLILLAAQIIIVVGGAILAGLVVDLVLRKWRGR
jgi:hypothetical protein